MPSSEARRFIVVEGPIGVGKTTLARRLAHTFGCELLLEAPEQNPFLDRFYRDMRSAAFQTQLSFLLQRARQLEALRQTDLFLPVQVADFLIEKDRLFASLTLDEAEMRLYDQVYAHLTLQAPTPDLVIYLHAPVELLLERIASRGRPYEREISPEYVARVAAAYARTFQEFDTAPLLMVDSAQTDLLRNDADYALLLQQIDSIQSGRHHFHAVAARFS